MNYHNIVKDDMRNGVGLRVTLFVSGCKHHCEGCHNPQTWNPESGVPFDEDAFDELKDCLERDYIDGITFSGGDPLFTTNRDKIGELAAYAKSVNKTVWLYTGYKLNVDENGNFNFGSGMGDYFTLDWLSNIDVLVDGPFDMELFDQAYHWAGSTNQRIIDVQKSLRAKKIVLFDDKTGGYGMDLTDPRDVTCECDRNS